MPEIADYMRVVASLALIVVIIYTLYYYFNNFVGVGRSKEKEIKIIETKAIGKQRFLILAKIKDAVILFSSDESGIKILKEWKEM